MTVFEHLGELRRRLIISILAVVVAGVIVFIIAPEIISFLVTFYHDATNGKRNSLIFLGPLDAFATRLKIATYGGIVLAAPVWLFQLWRFITPGLNPNEKRYAVPFILFAVLAFAGGVVFAYYAVLPITIPITTTASSPDSCANMSETTNTPSTTESAATFRR